jgi:hypothetical protein
LGAMSVLAKRTLKRWVALSLLGASLLAVGYVGLDRLQGRLLGIMVGTTTDPRQASIRGVRSLSMDPVIINMIDRTAVERIRDGELGEDIDPALSMAVPAAYITSIIMDDTGRRGSRNDIHFVQTRMLLDSDTPYWLEWARVAPIVADELGLRMLEPGDRHYRTNRPRARTSKL